MASRALGLPAFLGSDQFSDITLRFSGREFKAHRVILAAKSGWFRVAFESAFKEASADEIELHDDDPDALETALRFLYDSKPPNGLSVQGPLDVIMTEHLTLYELSNKYDIPSLAYATARTIHKLFNRPVTLLADARIAHALYFGLSHDEHDLKERYAMALCRHDPPYFNKEIEQFAQDNPSFALDIKSAFWQLFVESDIARVYPCKYCGFSMELHYDHHFRAMFDLMEDKCPVCQEEMEPFDC